jgi:hypothetical protein
MEDAGTERGWRYKGRGPFCIRSDPSRLSQYLGTSVHLPEKRNVIFLLFTFIKTPGVVSLEFYLLLSIESSEITPRVTQPLALTPGSLG